MKCLSRSVLRSVRWAMVATLVPLVGPVERATADPATLLFQDDFSGGIPGWTAVRPVLGAYLDGPMLWQYDKVSEAFSEQSNQYTDSSTFSGSRIAPMLIHGSTVPANFTYTARLTAGDDDAFGLIFGFENENVFYRVYFARQNRALAGWPFQGWGVDRMNNGQITDIGGPSSTFVNVAGVPFDVTINMTGGALTLTVTNDPFGAPTVTSLLTGAVLPVAPSPSTKVGLFSWGQSGGTPRAFRIQNPVLNGVPLGAAAAAQVLTNWSFTTTPSSTNDYPVNTGMWSQALGVNGDRGVMLENNDAAPENVTTSATNTPVFAAVAGDSNWSNYVYSVRFISTDNDGFGMFLRYQNRSNWYRISFRNQASQAGIKQGMTVQKSVNQVLSSNSVAQAFDQLYSNSVAGFIPPINVPFEVHAAIRNQRLQIIAINNPDGGPLGGTSGGTVTPSVTTSGPIDMDTSTIATNSLNTGKVGVFSWAQYGDNNLPNSTAPDDGTAVDWVKVRQVNGEALLVTSPFGTPNPPVGLNDLPVSQVVTATVDNVVQTAADVRQVSAGWVGIGSVPASGTTNQVVFTLGGFSSISWQWLSQYLLNTTVNPSAGGAVITTNGPWVPANQTTTVIAVASNGYVFSGWSGDSLLASSGVLTFPMARPVTLTANFAPDSDADGLPDAWEQLYFGNLTAQDGTGNPDGDGASNLAEFQAGTNPNFAEAVTVTDGLSSQWTNTCRDPELPGEVTVVDFGSGYRGAFNSNNENKASDVATFIPTILLSNNVSFQTGRLIVRSNIWNPAWSTNFTAKWELSVGDNDGNCFYFRYVNESNWMRITLCGEDPLTTLNRPFVGLSVQRRTNGFHSNIPLNPVSGPAFAAYTDPTDGTVANVNTPAGFKKVRVIVSATNQNFEVRVTGWNAFLGTPDFDPSFELVNTFVNDAPNVQGGSIGFAPWGEGGFAANANQVNGIPIPFGSFFDNITVRSPFSDSPVVFSENWETAALATNLPAGWTNPYTGVATLEGTWVVNVDGAISQLANQGSITTGTAADPKADAEANILLAPNQVSRNYTVQVGFHAFDNDGVGLVYDFVDTNNYSRVMFRSEATADGDIPPGLSVSRKSGGVWTDITAGDPAFLYTPGRPFEVTLANNNGDYNLAVRDLENPAAAATRWHWAGPSAAATNRFGVTTWFSPNAHVLYARASALPTIAAAVPFKITNISRSGGNVVLDISKPGGSSYHVLRAASVTGPYLTNAANQTAAQYTEPAPAGTAFYRLQLVP